MEERRRILVERASDVPVPVWSYPDTYSMILEVRATFKFLDSSMTAGTDTGGLLIAGPGCHCHWQCHWQWCQ